MNTNAISKPIQMLVLKPSKDILTSFFLNKTGHRSIIEYNEETPLYKQRKDDVIQMYHRQIYLHSMTSAAESMETLSATV